MDTSNLIMVGSDLDDIALTDSNVLANQYAQAIGFNMGDPVIVPLSSLDSVDIYECILGKLGGVPNPNMPDGTYSGPFTLTDRGDSVDINGLCSVVCEQAGIGEPVWVERYTTMLAAELRLSQVNEAFYDEYPEHPSNPGRIRMSPGGILWEIERRNGNRLTIKCLQTGQINVMDLGAFLHYEAVGDKWVVVPPRYMVINPARPSEGEAFDSEHDADSRARHLNNREA